MNRFRIAVQSSVRMLCIFLLAGNAYAATYKWVDENGKVQYTQTLPPAGIEAETIKPPPAVESDAAIKQMQEQDDLAAKLRKQRQEEGVQKERQEEALALQKKNCEMAKASRASYDHPLVKYVQADGSKVMPTEEQRQADIKKSDDMIKEFCK